MTSLVDPKTLSIPIRETDELIIDLLDQSVILFGPSPEIPDNKDYTQIRKTVYEKLVNAQRLLPDNLKLCVYEGYRGLELQKKLFIDRYTMLKKAHPQWGHEQLFKETTKLVSPIINLDGSINIPPHSTGAAIDVYMVDDKGNIVDMGIKVEDWMQDIDGSISQTDSSKISASAKRHRLLMGSALKEVGFVNYPGEYWHWSYGDRYWAYSTGSEFALYGIMEF